MDGAQGAPATSVGPDDGARSREAAIDMTTLTPRPGGSRTHRTHGSLAAHLAHPLDHPPLLLLAAAATLIVLAGPAVQLLELSGTVVHSASVLMMLAGVVLAGAAAWQLLRDLD